MLAHFNVSISSEQQTPSLENDHILIHMVTETMGHYMVYLLLLLGMSTKSILLLRPMCSRPKMRLALQW